MDIWEELEEERHGPSPQSTSRQSTESPTRFNTAVPHCALHRQFDTKLQYIPNYETYSCLNSSQMDTRINCLGYISYLMVG